MQAYKANYRRLNLEVKTIDGRRFIEYREMKAMGIPHLMSTRDMDLGFTTCGNEGAITEQYARMAKAMGRPSMALYVMRQVHSGKVVDTSDYGKTEDTYELGDIRVVRGIDGMITREANTGISVTVADCVPLVIYDPVKKCLANLHSGWKGTLQKIGQTGLELMMAKYGTKATDCRVFLGPHIGLADFEVTEEVASAFRTAFGEKYVHPKDETHSRIDLNSVITDMFIALGVGAENIYAAEESTVADPGLYHSFRRDGREFGIMSLLAMVE